MNIMYVNIDVEVEIAELSPLRISAMVDINSRPLDHKRRLLSRQFHNYIN